MSEILIKVGGLTQEKAERRAEILEKINKELDSKEMAKLEKIVNSKTARSYLSGANWFILKNVLKV